MTIKQKELLLEETRQTAACLNETNSFMASGDFPKLDREDKDLLYEQQRAMSTLVQILGKRLERAGHRFSHPTFPALERGEVTVSMEEMAYTLYDTYHSSVGEPFPPASEFFKDSEKTTQANAWRDAASLAVNTLS